MGESSGAGTAPVRSSVVSLTNGPSIMILGRLGVFPTQPVVPDQIHFAREIRIIVYDSSRIRVRLPYSVPASGSPALGRPVPMHARPQPARHLSHVWFSGPGAGLAT